MIPSIDVVIAAPLPLMLAGLRSLLEGQRDIAVVAACTSYASALRALRRLAPSVLVLDAAICEPGERLAFERLLAACPGVGIAVIAQRSASRANGHTLVAGRPAILPPDVSLDRLLQCVRALADGRSCSMATLPARTAAKPAVASAPGRGRSPLALLTFREREIAQGIARGKRNKEIAESFGIAPGTVKLHLHRIYAKLGVNGRLALFKKLAEEAQPRTER